MDIKLKKGYALVLAIIFVITLMAASIGLYVSSELLTKEVRFEEEQYIKGYYAAVAGLRYAEKVFIDNPATVITGMGAGNTYIVTNNALGDGEDFFNDIGVEESDLAITITYDSVNDEYAATAEYSY